MMMSVEPSEKLSFMQGPVAREGDVNKNKDVASSDGLKDERQYQPSSDRFIIAIAS